MRFLALLGAKDVKGISEPVGSWAAVRQSYDGSAHDAPRASVSCYLSL